MLGPRLPGPKALVEEIEQVERGLRESIERIAGRKLPIEGRSPRTC